MKTLLYTINLLLLIILPQVAMSQTLEKMAWFNEPEKWGIKNNSLTMSVTPKCDVWRVTLFGFSVDDAPFLYGTYGGEFEAKVKITGDYKTQFDQTALMLRIDHENQIKSGVEFMNGQYNISTVVTHKTSDGSLVLLDAKRRNDPNYFIYRNKAVICRCGGNDLVTALISLNFSELHSFLEPQITHYKCTQFLSKTNTYIFSFKSYKPLSYGKNKIPEGLGLAVLFLE